VYEYSDLQHNRRSIFSPSLETPKRMGCGQVLTRAKGTLFRPVGGPLAFPVIITAVPEGGQK
jgi:hypothetical protein